MSAMTRRACLSVALAVQFLLPGLSHGTASGASEPAAEVAKQEAIYQSRGEARPDGYVIDRALLSYASTLSPEFDRSLAELRPADRWLDIGAGRGLAVLDYYTSRYDAMHPEGREQRGSKAHAVALSIEDRRTSRWDETAARLQAGQIQYLSGKRLREYSRKELGRFKLITDVIGGFSYTESLSLFLERVLGLLEVKGDFFTLLLDVRTENRANGSYATQYQLLTQIENGEGAPVGVCSWLKRISCVQVTCESDAKATRPIELYRMHKVCENVAVPALTLLEYQAGTPPARRFSIRKPAPKPR